MAFDRGILSLSSTAFNAAALIRRLRLVVERLQMSVEDIAIAVLVEVLWHNRLTDLRAYRRLHCRHSNGRSPVSGKGSALVSTAGRAAHTATLVTT